MKKFITEGAKNFLKPIRNRGIGGTFFGKLFSKILVVIFNPINIDGSKLYLHQSDGIDFFIRDYQRSSMEILKKEVKEGDVVVDLGASSGSHTIIAAKIVGSRGKVFCFEADPVNCKLIEKSIKRNGYKNIVLEQKAVIDKKGKLIFYLEQGSKYHKIFKTKNMSSTIEVEAISLDDYFKNYGGKIDFIKIDIVGSEGKAIKGMVSTLQKNPAAKIYMEFSPDRIEKTNFEPIDCLKILTPP